MENQNNETKILDKIDTYIDSLDDVIIILQDKVKKLKTNIVKKEIILDELKNKMGIM